MSAYSSGRGSQIVSLPKLTGSTSSESFEHVSSLPQIGGEIENFFTVARQIEAALIQERSSLRKARDELRDLHVSSARAAAESENKSREWIAREEKLTAMVVAHQNNEKLLREQIAQITQQMELVRDEKKKTEFNSELLKANIQYLKDREDAVKDSHSVRDELEKYKAAWVQVSAMDRKAKQVLQESDIAKRKVDELTAALLAERRKCAKLEELVAREKREKQVALSCLHTAESRASHLSREAEDLRSRASRSFEESGLELKF